MAASRRRFAVAYRAAVLADSPVAYWRLGEASGATATDETGSYNGTYSGSPSYSQAGVFAANNAVRFPVSTAFVSSSNAAFYPGSGDFTFELWSKCQSSLGLSVGFMLGGKHISATNQRCFSLQLQAGGITPVEVFWRAFVSTNGTSVVTIGTGSLVSQAARPVTDWHHWALVRDGSTMRLYIDGVQEATAAVSGPLFNGSANFRIAGQGDGSQFVDCYMDEVAYYSTALSAARILAHYNAAGY